MQTIIFLIVFLIFIAGLWRCEKEKWSYWPRQAKGRALNNLADEYGLKRKWFESDKRFRARINLTVYGR